MWLVVRVRLLVLRLARPEQLLCTACSTVPVPRVLQWEASDSDSEDDKVNTEERRQQQRQHRRHRKTSAVAEADGEQQELRRAVTGQAAEKDGYSCRMVKGPRKAMEPFYVDLPPPNERYKRQRFVYKRFKP